MPSSLPLEEAVGQIARSMFRPHASAWCSTRRDASQAVVAVGGYYAPHTASLLGSLTRALLGSPEERTLALKHIQSLQNAIANERAVNWALIEAAQDLGIDTQWLVQSAQTFQIGLGARGKMFCQLTNQADSAIGWLVAKSKFTTVEALRKLGFPTTRATLVSSEADATTAAAKIGFPCVTKPLHLGKGQGITTRIENQRDLEAGIRLAIKEGAPPALVENHVEGIDHRILVSEGEVLWAYSKVAASVSGDGHSTVRALIEQENSARRGTRSASLILLEPIAIDTELTQFLARRYGIGLDHVLPVGDQIELAGQSNISLGGILADVTADLHPDNRELAIDIAESLHVSVLGIDFLTTDISRSWKEGDCAVIEVNLTPGISGAGDAALAMRSLFPCKRSGRIPVFAAVGGEAFCTTVGKSLHEAAVRAGARTRTVEWKAGKAGAAIEDRPPELARAALDPTMEALVLSCEQDAIEERGFPFVRADLIVAEDPLAFPFLTDVSPEIVPLPTESGSLASKVAAIVSDYADEADDPRLPTVTLREGTSLPDGFTIECTRFHAVPSAWFHRALGLPAPAKNGMLTIGDIFAAIESHANAALHKAGCAPLPSGIRFAEPGPGWAALSVSGTVEGREGDEIGQALSGAVAAVNAVLDLVPSASETLPVAAAATPEAIKRSA